jgi:transposase
VRASIRQVEDEVTRPGPQELRRLLQVHGLNLLSAISLLAEVGDIALFDTSKQLDSYAGLATSTKQSSETTRHGGIKQRRRKRITSSCTRLPTRRLLLSAGAGRRVNGGV